MIFGVGLRAIRKKQKSAPTPARLPTGWPAQRRTKPAASPGAGGRREQTRADRPPAVVTDLLRGRIYRAHLTHIGADKFFLVVSNNRRNRAFEQVLAARLTTTPPRDARPAMVPLGPGEIMPGWVSCDDIETLYDDEVRADLGAGTAATMRGVEAGLRAAFGMAE
jgi:mRNA interferase MazF